MAPDAPRLGRISGGFRAIVERAVAVDDDVVAATAPAQVSGLALVAVEEATCATSRG